MLLDVLTEAESLWSSIYRGFKRHCSANILGLQLQSNAGSVDDIDDNDDTNDDIHEEVLDEQVIRSLYETVENVESISDLIDDTFGDLYANIF